MKTQIESSIDWNLLYPIESAGNGMFSRDHNGVIEIYTARDKKAEFIVYEDKTLVFVKSALGYPAIYPLPEVSFEKKATAILMDLDGTSVRSEKFWMWVIELTIGKLLNNNKFSLQHEDEPHVSGHSVSEHLQYCIDKYCPGKTVEEARDIYFRVVDHEMQEILEGRGRPGAFEPSPGLKEFLTEVKKAGIKIGLVTSGLHEKAWPEILSAFRTLDMGNPLDFYDCIITAGYPLKRGMAGTLGELSPKPHPWLYAETARVGLGIEPNNRHKVIGFEDSSAGVLSLRLAGFHCIGLADGNIEASGMNPFLYSNCQDLLETLPLIL